MNDRDQVFRFLYDAAPWVIGVVTLWLLRYTLQRTARMGKKP